MVLKEEEIAGFQNFPVLDVNNELLRLARAGNAQFEQKYLRFSDEDDSIEEQYKVIFYRLLTTEERLNPRGKKNDKDDVTKEKERLETIKKRKAEEDVSQHDDDSNDAEEENDPQYELFLKHLKEHDKCYAPKYEKLGVDHNVSMHKGHTVVNEKINDQKRKNVRKLLIYVKSESRDSNKMPGVENQQCASDKKTKDLNCGKSRFETDKEEKPVHMRKGYAMVNENISGMNDRKKQSGKNLDRKMKQKVELSPQMPHLKTQCKLDIQHSSAKTTTSSTLKKSRNEAQNAGIAKCSASEFRKVMAAKRFMACKKIEEDSLEKEGNSRSDSDVEILDEAECIKRGTSNPFVSSKKFSKSMEEDGIGRSIAYEEFRKAVLNVLKKPYDKEEYTRHQEAIHAGSYFDYHPDLERKLKKYRYNRRKRLSILRGFFFWLQNLTQEGAFKPWKDRTCLAVEPPSP